jgi:hypothetical protein
MQRPLLKTILLPAVFLALSAASLPQPASAGEFLSPGDPAGAAILQQHGQKDG